MQVRSTTELPCSTTATYSNYDMEIYRIVAEHIWKYDMLLEIITMRKLRWFGHVVRARVQCIERNVSHNMNYVDASCENVLWNLNKRVLQPHIVVL